MESNERQPRGGIEAGEVVNGGILTILGALVCSRAVRGSVVVVARVCFPQSASSKWRSGPGRTVIITMLMLGVVVFRIIERVAYLADGGRTSLSPIYSLHTEPLL